MITEFITSLRQKSGDRNCEREGILRTQTLQIYTHDTAAFS